MKSAAMKKRADCTQKAEGARRASLILLLMLLLLMTVETLLQAPAHGAAIALVITLKLLPPACLLPALWRARADAALWLALLLLPYFCWAVLGAFAPGWAGWLALLRSLLLAACLGAVLLFAHWQGQAHRA